MRLNDADSKLQMLPHKCSDFPRFALSIFESIYNANFEHIRSGSIFVTVWDAFTRMRFVLHATFLEFVLVIGGLHGRGS